MSLIDRKQPVTVTIKKRYPLTKESSTKQTWHVILDLSGTKLDYHPGDSIGIYAQNDPLLVEHLIEALQEKPETEIVHKRSGNKMPLVTFLTHHANLARITSSFLRLIHESEECPDCKGKINSLLDPENKPALRAFLAETDPLNLIRDLTKTKLPLQDFCDQFGPLLPRFYSVASSKLIDENTLDLTVALFTWMQGEEKRYGVASHFLCHLAEIGKTPIPIYVQHAPHFRLPKDHAKDIIMVGPGTGIAPFRAFMQERKLHGATGGHLLFFGERNKKSDFFYEEEWAGHDNLDVHTAFSRDQEEKHYVQHRMLEEGKTIFSWLEKGGHLYVCGDAKKMAKDVDKALLSIFETEGKLSPEEAKQHLKALKKQGQYLLDVY